MTTCGDSMLLINCFFLNSAESLWKVGPAMAEYHSAVMMNGVSRQDIGTYRGVDE
jgi:hypothetical protein